jgi:hypothetical protein
VANFRYRRFSALRARRLASRSESGINDNNKGNAAGFAGHDNQCPGRERLFHCGDHRSQYLIPAESVPTEASLLLALYAAARTIPLALFALAAIYKRATPALLILGSLAGAMQLLDAGIGPFERDFRQFVGPLFIAVLQLFVVYLLHRSVLITPQTKHGCTHAMAMARLFHVRPSCGVKRDERCASAATTNRSAAPQDQCR